MSVFHYPSTLISLSSHSDVQLHFAWQKERPHLEHNHVDVPVPGSGSHYLSVLSGVVCPALLSPEGGTAYKNHTMYILSKDAVKFSYSEWESTQIQLLIVLFLFQPSFFELLKPRSWSCERPDDRLWWAVSYSWAAGTTIIADQYKWDQPVCYCHNFWTFVLFKVHSLFECMEKVSAKKSQQSYNDALFVLSYQLQNKIIVHTTGHVDSYFYSFLNFLTFPYSPLPRSTVKSLLVPLWMWQ